MKRVDKQYLKSIEADKILEVTRKGTNYKLKKKNVSVILKRIKMKLCKYILTKMHFCVIQHLLF